MRGALENIQKGTDKRKNIGGSGSKKKRNNVKIRSMVTYHIMDYPFTHEFYQSCFNDCNKVIALSDT